mmetsp:Transcript_13706/g.6796  ORF Transcript_13706/g.6796 Transcript_13706/m.6796 type:complete len:102 (+) Transcript_13706:556-861(+)
MNEKNKIKIARNFVYSPDYIYFAPINTKVYHMKDIDFVYKEKRRLTSKMFIQINFSAVLGVDYGCEGQIFNHIPGSSVYSKINSFVEAAKEYADEYESYGL